MRLHTSSGHEAGNRPHGGHLLQERAQEVDEKAQTNPATAQMMIINPFSIGGISALFMTHRPTEERIHRLLAMAV